MYCQENQDKNQVEGVIKFTYAHQYEIISDSLILDYLNTIRSRCYQLGWIGQDDKGVGYGNISLRNDIGFYITASQTGHIPHLQIEDITWVKEIDFNKFHLRSQGAKLPSSESMTHALLYQNYPEAGAVIHIHQNEYWQKYFNILPTTDVNITYGSIEMIQELQSFDNESTIINVYQNNVIMMGGHYGGIITIGYNLEHALESLLKTLK